jgi:hypothetical protein
MDGLSETFDYERVFGIRVKLNLILSSLSHRLSTPRATLWCLYLHTILNLFSRYTKQVVQMSPTLVEAKRRTTMITRGKTNHYKTTARIVGVLYIAGFVVGIGGNILVQSILGAPNHLAVLSANSLTVALGAVLWLMAVAWDAAHGVLMFPVLKQHDERVAVGYLGFRIMDAVFIAVMVLFILLQIPLGNEYLKAGADTSYLQTLSTVFMQGQLYAYDLGMSALGLAGLMLCYTLYKAKLVPRVLAVWGLVGYGIIFCGMVSEVMGSGLGLISSLPGGLWEVFIGVWLIVKGFNSSAAVLEPDITAINANQKGVPAV